MKIIYVHLRLVIYLLFEVGAKLIVAEVDSLSSTYYLFGFALT